MMMKKIKLSPLLFCAVAFGLLVSAGCTTGGEKDVPGITNFGRVMPDVWRGSKPTPKGMQWLAQNGVKTIIDLQMDDESAIIPAGVKYVPIRITQWHCDQLDVKTVVAAIEQSSKPVFIHCNAGRDRTGLAVAAWQISRGMTAEQAIADNERFGHNTWFDAAIRRRIRQLAAEQESASAAR